MHRRDNRVGEREFVRRLVDRLDEHHTSHGQGCVFVAQAGVDYAIKIHSIPCVCGLCGDDGAIRTKPPLNQES